MKWHESKYLLWFNWEKIIFKSRRCVKEWKLVVVYHWHGQTIHFMVYNFTRKSHLTFVQRNPSYWKMTTDGTQIFLWNFLGQTTFCCLQVYILLKQPKMLCSIWGNSQTCWILLVRKAHKIPLRKLGYSTPHFLLCLYHFWCCCSCVTKLNWVSCHVECWNSPFNIVHCLFQDSLCCWQSVSGKMIQRF